MATQQQLETAHNAAAKLDPKFAFFLPNAEAQSIPLQDQKEVRIAWAFSTDDNYAELEKFLTIYTWPTNSDTPLRYVDSPEVGGTPLPGIWRQAFITRIERRGEDRQEELLIVLTLRRGWQEKIDWTEALLVSSKDSDGNATSVPDVSNTSSYNDASAVIVRFPNISPYKMRDCMAEFSASTYSNFTVQDVSFEDTWNKAFVTGRIEDDGSASVELILSRQRFTVEVYKNASAPNEETTYKIWKVPRGDAQAIATSWKSTGRSADIQYSDADELCTVVLSDSADFDENAVYLSLASCSLLVIEKPYFNADAPLDAPDNVQGIEYRASGRLNGQTGKWDGSIEERYRQTLHVASTRTAFTPYFYEETERWEGAYSDIGGFTSVSLAYDGGVLTLTPTPITSIPSTTSLTAGVTWRLEKSRNSDCTYNIAVVKRTAIEVDEAGRLTTADYFTERVQEIARNKAAGGDDVVSLVGEDGTTIRVSRWTYNEQGLYDNEITDDTPVARDTGWIEYTDRYGTSYYRWFRNQTLEWITGELGPVVDITDATSNSLSVAYNQHGRIDGTASRKTVDNNSDDGYFWYAPAQVEARVDKEYRRVLVKPNAFAAAVYEDQYRNVVVVKIHQVVPNRAAAKLLQTDLMEKADANAGGAIGEVTFDQLVSTPDIVPVRDEAGRLGFYVEAFYKAFGDWEAVPVAAPAE